MLRKENPGMQERICAMFISCKTPLNISLLFLGLCMSWHGVVTNSAAGSMTDRHAGSSQDIFINVVYSSSSSSSSFCIQPRDISTALDHFLYILLLAWGLIEGVNEARLARFICLSSEKSFQMSMAKPAAMAAPRAVVSCIEGRSTGIWMISA